MSAPIHSAGADASPHPTGNTCHTPGDAATGDGHGIPVPPTGSHAAGAPSSFASDDGVAGDAASEAKADAAAAVDAFVLDDAKRCFTGARHSQGGGVSDGVVLEWLGRHPSGLLAAAQAFVEVGYVSQREREYPPHWSLDELRAYTIDGSSALVSAHPGWPAAIAQAVATANRKPKHAIRLLNFRGNLSVVPSFVTSVVTKLTLEQCSGEIPALTKAEGDKRPYTCSYFSLVECSDGLTGWANAIAHCDGTFGEITLEGMRVDRSTGRDLVSIAERRRLRVRHMCLVRCSGDLQALVGLLQATRTVTITRCDWNKLSGVEAAMEMPHHRSRDLTVDTCTGDFTPLGSLLASGHSRIATLEMRSCAGLQVLEAGLAENWFLKKLTVEGLDEPALLLRALASNTIIKRLTVKACSGSLVPLAHALASNSSVTELELHACTGAMSGFEEAIAANTTLEHVRLEGFVGNMAEIARGLARNTSIKRLAFEQCSGDLAPVRRAIAANRSVTEISLFGKDADLGQLYAGVNCSRSISTVIASWGDATKRRLPKGVKPTPAFGALLKTLDQPRLGDGPMKGLMESMGARWDATWVELPFQGRKARVLPFSSTELLVADEGEGPRAAASRNTVPTYVVATLHMEVTPWWQKLAACGKAVLSVADVVTDVQVAVEFALAGNQWGLFASSITVLVAFHLYSSWALWGVHRRASALWQLAGLGIVYDTYEVVQKEKVEGIRVPFHASAAAYGAAAVAQLKAREALFESAPQLLIQAYAALTADLTTALAISITISAVSLAMVFVSSDKQAVTDHALKGTLGVPLAAAAKMAIRDGLVVSLPPGATWTVSRSGGKCARLCNTAATVRPAPDPYAIIIMFRVAEVLARLGAAALLAAAVGPWVFVALGVAVVNTLGWWSGVDIIPLMKRNKKHCLIVMAAIFYPVVWIVFECLMVPFLRWKLRHKLAELHPLRENFPTSPALWLSVLLTTTIGSPGVATVTMPPWMQPVKMAVEDVCLPDWLFMVHRTLENLGMVALAVLLGDEADFGFGTGRLWHVVVASSACAVLAAFLFPVYLWRCRQIPRKFVTSDTPTLKEHMRHLGQLAEEAATRSVPVHRAAQATSTASWWSRASGKPASRSRVSPASLVHKAASASDVRKQAGESPGGDAATSIHVQPRSLVVSQDAPAQ